MRVKGGEQGGSLSKEMEAVVLIEQKTFRERERERVLQ